MTRTLALLLAALAAGCGNAATPGRGAPGRSEAVVKFTAIPDQNAAHLKAKFLPLQAYLSEKLGVRVEYQHVPNYQAAVEVFRNGDVMFAWYGGLTGVQARHFVKGARAIAQGEADPRYYSYFIAHKSTGLKRSDAFPQAIANLKFLFGSRSSTSGRLMPEFFIRNRTGKGPDQLFGQVGYSGDHDKTAELVESGQWDAGAINYKVYDRRVREGKTDPDVCRIIWKTPLYADYSWTVRPDLDARYGDGLTAKLKSALVAIDDPKLLAALPRQRLIPARNEEFEGIRRVAEDLELVRSNPE